jgi:DNA (cytosine-5)-methyltransferase 1
LNASRFGVPQRRRRTFILGYRQKLHPPSYPEPDGARDGDSGERSPTVWDAIGDLPRIEGYPDLYEKDGFCGPLGPPSYYACLLRVDTAGTSGRFDRDSLAALPLTGCLRTRHSQLTVRRFRQTKPGSAEAVSRFQRLDPNGVAPTIRAGTGSDRGSHTAPRPIHPYEPRCITVREAARLHSFPDWFRFDATRWHAFRQIGNSVPPLLAQAVAASLLKTCSL